MNEKICSHGGDEREMLSQQTILAKVQNIRIENNYVWFAWKFKKKKIQSKSEQGNNYENVNATFISSDGK